MSWIFAVILGVSFSLSFAFLLVMISVCNSNKMGDTKGTFLTFTKGVPLTFLQKMDNIKKSEYTRLMSAMGYGTYMGKPFKSAYPELGTPITFGTSAYPDLSKPYGYQKSDYPTVPSQMNPGNAGMGNNRMNPGNVGMGNNRMNPGNAGMGNNRMNPGNVGMGNNRMNPGNPGYGGVPASENGDNGSRNDLI